MWFFTAALAFFLLAVAAVADKFLLSKSRLSPVAYAFYIAVIGGILSGFLLFWEADFYFPGNQLIVLLIGGIAFYFALLAMFQAVARSEVSRVNPLVVSLSPLLAYFFSFFLGLEYLTGLKLLGIFLIIAGSYGLSQAGLPKTRLKPEIWLYIVSAGILFALANVFSKVAYNNLSFVNAFVWLRWATLTAAVLFTLPAGRLRKIFSFKKHQPEGRRKWPVFLIGQAAGAIGVFLMQYAIKLGSVTLVTALQGIQFFFVMVIVYLLSKFAPKILEEDIRPRLVALKIAWSAILFAGVALILI